MAEIQDEKSEKEEDDEPQQEDPDETLEEDYCDIPKKTSQKDETMIGSSSKCFAGTTLGIPFKIEK